MQEKDNNKNIRIIKNRWKQIKTEKQLGNIARSRRRPNQTARACLASVGRRNIKNNELGADRKETGRTKIEMDLRS